MARAAGTMDEDDDQTPEGENVDPSAPPLDERVINAVERCPNRTIRPARLAADLGISVDDACSELCGLLSAVGGGEGGAFFTFEAVGKNDGSEDISSPGGEGSSLKSSSSPTTMTMVFTFPPDFKRRALRRRRTEDIKSVLWSILYVSLKILKVIVAFGLVVSLAILTVAALCTLVAALIAISRGGGGGRDHRAGLMRRIQSTFYTLRQLLWCYAMYGGTMEGQDPFLAEVAGNLWMAMSLFCGNPFSFAFWWRANMLNRRRERSRRGWGRGFGGSQSIRDTEGIALIQSRTWRDEINNPTRSSSRSEEESYRGLLSVAVEFLFGPTPFWPGPSESDKWKLRAAAILSMSSSASSAGKKGVRLAQLLPYSDSPPATLEDCSEGLRTVVHFNGVPVTSKSDNETKCGEARFMFPELMAESDDGLTIMTNAESVNIQPNDDSWAALFYTTPSSFGASGQTLDGSSTRNSSDIPPYLQERRHSLTKLESDQFIRCLFLGGLNYIGLVWLRQSMGKGGLLEISSDPLSSFAFGVLSFLRFYAKLFFVLPAVRLVFIMLLNKLIDKRNQRRIELKDAIQDC